MRHSLALPLTTYNKKMLPRRSTRLSLASATDKKAQEPDKPDQVIQPPGPTKKHKMSNAKGQKATAPKLRRNRGKLGKLPEMPLDIIFEVSSCALISS